MPKQSERLSPLESHVESLLLDDFAGKAMAAIISTHPVRFTAGADSDAPEEVARAAYQVARAMIERRRLLKL